MLNVYFIISFLYKFGLYCQHNSLMLIYIYPCRLVRSPGIFGCIFINDRAVTMSRPEICYLQILQERQVIPVHTTPSQFHVTAVHDQKYRQEEMSARH